MRAPELLHLPLTGPYERLVRPCEHLDRLGESGVARHRSMAATVRADQEVRGDLMNHCPRHAIPPDARPPACRRGTIQP